MTENRRVQYSVSRLNESLLKQLTQKPVTQIKVTELCRDANVNRSTYYVHFSNPADQLYKMEEKILKELDVFLNRFLETDRSDAREQYYIIKDTLEYFDKNRSVMKVLLIDGGDKDFIFRWLRRSAGRVLGDLKKENIKHYEFMFSSMGCYGIIQYWIISETETSVEDLAQIIIMLLQKLNQS